MKAALLIVLSLSALAMASPAINKNTNQIEVGSTQFVQAKAYGANVSGDYKQTPVTEQLKQWCFASSKSQIELTASFKKLVSLVQNQPEDWNTEEAVMSERICSSAIKTTTAAEQQQQVDPMAHELIKDVYMDALLACDKRECSQQLMKVVDSEEVDSIRASYYMTRIALQDKQSIKKDDQEIKEFVETYITKQQQQQQQTTSESVERQKLFAVTSLLGKSLDKHPESQELTKLAQQLAKNIVDRYIKTVTIDEVKSYKQQPTNAELAKKIAKRSAALKALANLPSFIIKEVKEIEQLLVKIAHQKEELVTVRQSAIECLEQNEQVMEELKELTFAQEEPIEVRVAAYRALMTAPFASGKDKQEQVKQQLAAQIVDQIVKHCEQKQQQDDQFVVYAVSHLNNLRSSQQPEHQAVKEVIVKSKQHSMQIQLLAKKLKQQLKDVRQWSRNYKLEQEFAQLESGLIVEGDLIYESKQKQQQQWNILPKVIRVNMSMPVMGETVNVLEITLRQDQMDQELVEALKLVQSAKFNSETVTKVVDSFKNSVEQSGNKKNSNKIAEADLTIKCEGQTIVYLTCDDFRYATAVDQVHRQRNTRSTSDYYYYSSRSIIEKMLEHLKRQPVNFNRGFNFNFNDRLAKVLDIDASVIAGLRFESRVLNQQARPEDFEVVAQIEPRFAFEAVVGPSKMSQKKLLQRISSKSAFGLRYRYKQGELVDMQIDLPMNSMDLFTLETQMVEKINESYTYLADSVYGQQDIYSPDEEFVRYNTYNSYNTFGSNKQQQQQQQLLDQEDDSYPSVIAKRAMVKRSIFAQENKSTLVKMIQNKRAFVRSMETPEEVARATGLRGKLRLMASPKDCQYLLQVIVQKYEPTMQGYRFQIQKTQQDQYQVAISAPGSRVQRQLIVRLQKQIGQQRAVVKVEVQSAKMSSAAQWEIIYDGRQYAIKTMIVATNLQGKQQWRHQLELGCQRSQSAAKTATVAYKPYLVLDSSAMKRPIQMQGLVAIQQQEPKTVISYEFKSPINVQDAIQGKLILESRKQTTTATSFNKRTTSYRRSMQSPIELLLTQDWTIVSDFVGQIDEHSAKVHQMIDWSVVKMSLQAELAVQHKNLRKQIDQQIVASLKVDEQQQMVTVQRKCPQLERNDFRLTLTSDLSKPSQHVFLVEGRYQDKRGKQQLVVYKHKLDYQLMMQQQKLELVYQTELVNTKYNMEEKFQGRSQLSWSPKGAKIVKADISCLNRPVQAKFELEFISLEQHQILFQVQKQQFQHRTTVRADRRQCQLVSRTDKKNQLVAKTVFEMDKQLGEAKLNIEMPQQQLHLVADLKLNKSGRPSSIALQSARFAGKTEFSFMPIKSTAANWMLPIQSFRVKSDLKDLMNKEAYWMDSQLYPYETATKSYFRADSPIYRTELEFDPRDYSTKLASFARSKRSVEQQLYSNSDDVDFDFDTKMNLANKLWMVRSLIQSPRQLEQLKQQARRALFEYADRRQQQKHQLNWSPIDQRVSFAFDRQPIDTTASRNYLKPMHLAGDLHTSLFNKLMPTTTTTTSTSTANTVRPSSLRMQSEWADVDAELMPFNGETSFAKLSALSRHRRSAFKKHESEIRYQKHQGYKAWMKHQDSKDRRHQWQLEADESPKKWAKLSMDSDKHGKVDYEHKWHKYVTKRSTRHPSTEAEDVYSNSISFKRQPIDQDQDWSHSTQFSWDEPLSFVTSERVRRSVFDIDTEDDSETGFDYSPINYLKRVSGHLQSQTRLPSSQLYDIDFDYKPIDKYSRLSVAMPNDMLHQSEIEYLPTERLYKLQSKLLNRRNQQQVPEYQLTASTKPVWAQQEQEQLIVAGDYQHQPLIKLFRQPIKFDYTDKTGRVARFNYDLFDDAAKQQSTIAGGLRKKRAALYFKDAANDFEHNSSFHFYPEQVFSKVASRRQHFGDFVVKADTKYGPIVMHADTTEQNTIELSLDSPFLQAKLSTEISPLKRNAQIVKIQVDNKQKSASLYKLVRKTPVLADCRMVEKLAQKFDESRFEHQTEMLVSFVETIFKINSQTMLNKRPVMMIEGELNQQLNKAYVKFNGADRLQGQLLVDLVKQTMQLVVEGDDKRTFQHQTRLVRVSDKFFSLDSMTSYKQQPLFKLSGKVSSSIFEEPEHLFSSSRRMESHEEHVSTFDAIIYEPREYQISGQYDCLKKEARLIVKDVETRKTQSTIVKFDENSRSIILDAHLNSPMGPIYVSKGKFNLKSIFEPIQCRGNQSCQSELFYNDANGSQWFAKYLPGEYISIATPRFQRTISV